MNKLDKLWELMTDRQAKVTELDKQIQAEIQRLAGNGKIELVSLGNTPETIYAPFGVSTAVIKHQIKSNTEHNSKIDKIKIGTRPYRWTKAGLKARREAMKARLKKGAKHGN